MAGHRRQLGDQLPAAFERIQVAAVAVATSQPTLRLGADGRALLAFQAGPPGVTATWIATIDENAPNRPSVEVRRLTSADQSATPPRVALTRAGDIVGTYVGTSPAGTYPRFLRWSAGEDDPSDAPIGAVPTGDTVPAIAIDAQDRPIVAHVFSDLSLRVARLDNGAWTRETVEVGVVPFDSTLIDMTLDASGQPALVGSSLAGTAYGGGGGDRIPSAMGLTAWVRGSSGWTRERMATGYPGIRAQLRLAPDGALQAYFSSAGYPTMARAVRRGEQDWREDVPLAGDDGRTLRSGAFDVAIGGGGEVHVAHTNEHGVGYAIYDGCRWSEAIVVSDSGDAPTIALDSGGRPRIGYEIPTATDNYGQTTMVEVWYAHPTP